MQARLATVSVLLLALAISPVYGNEANFGVDDWTATEFSKYIKNETDIDVTSASIEAFGLNGATLSIIADPQLDWSSLGLKPTELVVVKKSLQKLLHRMDSKPADFWEWRAANRRLFDMWISPLSMSPRALLIWMRFYDGNAAIENINDEVDETDNFTFWLQWIFVPHYPLYQIAAKFTDKHSYIDELAKFLTGAGVVGDVTSLITFPVFLATIFVGTPVAFICAQAFYSVLWWIIPLWFTTYCFYFQIYVILPLVCIAGLFGARAAF